MKRILATVISVLLVATMDIGGSIAYLQDEDSAVNVMTMGSVYIDQLEKERVTKTNSGNDELQDYTQDKHLYPAVGEISWIETDEGRVNQEWPAGGSSALFDTDKLNNEVDKFVFVKNTGKSDAYVRTLFAFEAGPADGECLINADNINNKLIHWNRNETHWDWTDFSEDMSIEVSGTKYYVRIATYMGSDTVHPGGILPKTETTRPSLLQVFLDKTADNELCESFGDSYDILVLSQAVQTAGFSGAEIALNTAFNDGKSLAESKAKIAEWFKSVYEDSKRVNVEGTNKAAVLEAIDAAKPGDISDPL